MWRWRSAGKYRGRQVVQQRRVFCESRLFVFKGVMVQRPPLRPLRAEEQQMTVGELLVALLVTHCPLLPNKIC